ncbi:hypothetical protein Tco_0869827 [Tanacetum coccineum]
MKLLRTKGSSNLINKHKTRDSLTEVFRKILDICPRFKGEEFTKVQDDDVTLTFLINLGYKGPLYKYTNMYVDHMHQPWRTLAAIINKCLSRKTELIDVSEESEPKPAKKKTDSRSTGGVFIKDPPSAPKPKPTALKLKLKGVQSLTPKEQEAACFLIGIPGVPDESTVIFATSSERTGTKPRVPGEEKVIFQANVILKWGSENESEHFDDSQLNFDVKEKIDNDGDADDEGDDHISDIQDTDDEDAKIESDVDEIYKYKIHVRKDVNVEMAEAETVEHENKEKDEMIDAAKAYVEKTAEEKGDAELAGNVITSDYQVKVSTEFSLPSSSLSISSGFGTQFLNSSFDISLTSVLRDSAEAYVSYLMYIHIQQETSQIQSSSVQKVPVSVIPETTNLLPIPKILTETLVSTTISPPHVTPTISIMQQTITPIPTLPITTDAPTVTTVVLKSDALIAVQLRVSKLENDVSELKKIDHSAEALATLTSSNDLIQKYFVKPAPVSSKIQNPTIDLEQESEKSALEIRKIKREQAEKQKMPKYTIKSIDKVSLKEYDLKSALYQTMHENKSFNRTPANHALYHALMEDLIEDENVMDKGVSDTVKNHKRQHDDDDDDDDEDPSARPNQLWYRSHMNKFSKHNVYFTQKLLSVKSVSVKKLHGYGHLEEVVVKRLDRQLYKFKEGDFVDLHLNDIEDMLILTVQHKLFHLNDNDIVDFIVALCMFTRSIVIKRRVEDLQLGVESNQKKLKITAPQQNFLEIEFKELYTSSYKPPGVIYEDSNKQKRVMRADKLYKFSDRTLKKVRDELHHRILDFHLGYNDEMSRRKLTAVDKKRSELMVKLVDKQMHERRIQQKI